MPAERVAMRLVREVLRLTFVGWFQARDGAPTGVAASTVRATIAAFPGARADLAAARDDDGQRAGSEAYRAPARSRAIGVSAEPDWAVLHRELKRKHVTLSILWDEYIEAHPDGYRY